MKGPIVWKVSRNDYVKDEEDLPPGPPSSAGV
jgi:hypothetical protein